MKIKLTFIAAILVFNISIINAQVSDYEGNVYPTVHIGNQTWMAENLRSTKYSDGSLIPNSCWYENNVTDTIFGRLYVWEAAMKNSTQVGTQGACPSGWHIPSNSDWIELFNSLGDSNSCAIALKDTGSTLWDQPLIASGNSGFNIVGAGHGYNCFVYQLRGTHAEFWTSNEIDNYSAKNWSTNNQSAKMFRHYNQDKANNFSIRCVSDVYLGIKESKPTEFKVYPNPFNTYATVKFPSNLSNVSITLLNVLGQEMYSVSGSGSKYTLQRNDLKAGVYFIRVRQNGNNMATQRVLITN
jgi:uncharacterized protein (TIGR02145 family)